jgi:hypothetical protein
MRKQPKTVLVSPTEYANMRRIHRSLVYRLIKQGRITTIAGKLNPERADRERVRTTRPRVSPVTARPSRLICIQCGDPAGFTVEEARLLRSPSPDRFCWRVCAADYAAGKTTQQTRNELTRSMLENGGWTRAELIEDGYGDWL